MPSTLDLRRRIRSVKNTQQITRAMKMVAAAKLRRAQDRMMAARPYAGALHQILQSVASRIDESRHPLLSRREEKNVLLLVVTADKGLCGAFNMNAIKAGQNALRDQPWQTTQLITVGRKGSDFFRRRGVEIRTQAINVFQALSTETARDLAQLIIEDYAAEKVDAVYIVSNEFKSMISQRVVMQRLLPIAEIKREEGEPEIDYLYEPSPEEILQNLLPKYVEFQLHRTLLESSAAEHAARMTAMEAATKNASEMIDRLTLSYNRLRQAAITKEIIEIVSGASALG
ncbi:MAG TPA: ATP synthase F1 subunit gamma [Thermoanaerobaculia bacterium]|nr:ATP synthase F1 subunit gamma [Thermoanaerobaculia bacterium]